MDHYNAAHALASEVYLVQHWQDYSGSIQERRNAIFKAFVKLGIRGRWPWHKLAETFTFNDDERQIRECRAQEIRMIATWIGSDLRRVMVTDADHPMTVDMLKYRTDAEGNDMLICEHSGNPYEILPELVYSMTAYDDPDDVEEARQVRDQSLWVTGVFWLQNKIVWVDEYGDVIRENIVASGDGLQEADDCFERLEPFQSTWWTEATRVGKYAGDQWWH